MNAELHTVRASRSGGSTWRKLSAAVAVFLVVAATSVLGQSEDGIKAAFLYNFGKFTEWPGKAFTDGNTPITVGFIGADSLADMFEKNVTGKNANGRDFVVKKLAGGVGAESCHILFIGDATQVAAVMAALKGKPVLTAGEGDGFSEAGGMIRFIKDGAKVSFDLNLGAASGVALKLDPKVRQIARNVKGG